MTTPTTAAGRALLERRSAFNGGKHASVTLPSEQWNEAILAIEAEARAPYTDSQDRWRLVRVQPDVLAQWGTRTEDGDRLTVEWGEPDDDGIYEPTFTRHGEDNLRAEARAAALDEARAAVEGRGKRLTSGPGQDSEDVTLTWAFAEALDAIDAIRERSGE